MTLKENLVLIGFAVGTAVVTLALLFGGYNIQTSTVPPEAYDQETPGEFQPPIADLV